MMADRPILFSAPMVLALLAGRKTQTRRILRLPRWASTDPNDIEFGGSGAAEVICRDTGCLATLPLPFAVGDRLWVKETWQTGSGFNGPQIAFRATGDCHDIEAWDGEDEGIGPSFNYARCPGARWHTWLPDLLSGAEGIWRPSLFMPRWASRLTLLVTDVRVERLNDIGEADAQAEGVQPICDHGVGNQHLHSIAFQQLWCSLHGDDAWIVNPWVVAVGFSVHGRNIDKLPAMTAEAAE
jgi:hypothetical protein